jgi:DNA-binding beta-propeller fold protein YncE
MNVGSLSNTRRSNQSITVASSLIFLVASLTIPTSTFNVQAQAQENYVFVQEFAPNEQFSNPDITIDKQTGNIYVADYFNNRVVKLSSSGNVINSGEPRVQPPGNSLIHKMSNLTLLGLYM